MQASIIEWMKNISCCRLTRKYARGAWWQNVFDLWDFETPNGGHTDDVLAKLIRWKQDMKTAVHQVTAEKKHCHSIKVLSAQQKTSKIKLDQVHSWISWIFRINPFQPTDFHRFVAVEMFAKTHVEMTQQSRSHLELWRLHPLKLTADAPENRPNPKKEMNHLPNRWNFQWRNC